MTKSDYRTYCEATPDLPLFMQAWWMDAVCVGKQWDVIAGMPCLIRKRFGMRFVLMPQETQIAGAMSGNAADIAAALDASHLAYYFQHYPIGSPLPEQLQHYGFRIRPHVTYRIEDLHDMEAVEKAFSENKRRQIRKAAGLKTVEVSPADFYRFHDACMQEQGKQIAYSEAFFRSLNAACEAHNARHIIGLATEAGELCAAVFLVYDKQTCYYLIPCYSPRYKDSGAGARLALEAIRFAATHSRVFDFEGSMIPGVANHYAQFGSKPIYFYEVEKVYNPLALMVLRVYRFLTRKKR